MYCRTCQAVIFARAPNPPFPTCPACKARRHSCIVHKRQRQTDFITFLKSPSTQANKQTDVHDDDAKNMRTMPLLSTASTAWSCLSSSSSSSSLLRHAATPAATASSFRVLKLTVHCCHHHHHLPSHRAKMSTASEKPPLKKRSVVSSFLYKFVDENGERKPKVALFKRSGQVRTYP